MPSPRLLALLLLSAPFLLISVPAWAQPALTVDLAGISPATEPMTRVHGSTGSGASGVPVAGGFDCDGDGHVDSSFASMRATPLGRNNAGIVYLVFGSGALGETLDTATPSSRVLQIIGDGAFENSGSELWMDDVTGDGKGDLLIARQNYWAAPGREGAGALTLIAGSASLRTLADLLQVVDLRTPPASLDITTFVGIQQAGRLGIWMRTGDVTGDGIADIVVGADQESAPGENHRGAVYVIRGGAHLAATQTVDLVDFGAGGTLALDGHIAKRNPPALPQPIHYHFGATCQIADLDGNGRGEVLVAAALNRAGAALPALGTPADSAHATGGSVDGTLYIAWDDNFTANPWPDDYEFDLDLAPGSYTILDGGVANREFGEEILGGLDYDDDGKPDLFVGDIVGDLSGERTNSGSGHLIYDAAKLADVDADYDDLATAVPGIVTTDFLGADAGDIAADTAAHGDFDGDGIADLAFSSPHGSPLGRTHAGEVHIFHGQEGPWPMTVDLKNPPSRAVLRFTHLLGALGSGGGNVGDTLAYSAAAGDYDGDGRLDLVTNEMQGDGLGGTPSDVGNLLIVSGALLHGAGATEVPALPWGAAGALAIVLLAVASGALRRRTARR
jgi:hypothetical protein